MFHFQMKVEVVVNHLEEVMVVAPVEAMEWKVVEELAEERFHFNLKEWKVVEEVMVEPMVKVMEEPMGKAMEWKVEEVNEWVWVMIMGTHKVNMDMMVRVDHLLPHDSEQFLRI